MTVFFDTSAVMALHIESPLRALAAAELAQPTCVSAIALTEALALIAKLTDEPVVQADLVLCGPVVAREAWMMDRTLEAYYAHLLVHGTLHAQGYDHETNERDALEMEALEVLLVQALGYPNPY